MLKSQAYKKRYILLNYTIRRPTMSAETVSVNTDFDIVQNSVQTPTRETIEIIYKPIASVDQSD